MNETQGKRLFTEVHVLLGDECGCGKGFLECDDTCCPNEDGMLDWMCAGDTMRELKEVLDLRDQEVANFD
jgi:hypothetical protein